MVLSWHEINTHQRKYTTYIRFTNIEFFKQKIIKQGVVWGLSAARTAPHCQILVFQTSSGHQVECRKKVFINF